MNTDHDIGYTETPYQSDWEWEKHYECHWTQERRWFRRGWRCLNCRKWIPLGQPTDCDCDRQCPMCKGDGLDKKHKWPDGSFASCETCEGYGTISAFADLPDDVRENIDAMVHSHELSAILNEIAEAALRVSDENGLDDEQAKNATADAGIIFRAAAQVSN